jgi:hypothetical protein
MTPLIGRDTRYVGTQHGHLQGRNVRIWHVIRDDGRGRPVLLTQDDEVGGIEGVTARDRIDVFPLDERGRVSFRGWDVPAADLECFQHLAGKADEATNDRQ